jgi:hypothetical protein
MARSISYPADPTSLATLEDIFWTKIWQLLLKDQIGDNLIYHRGCHWFWKLSDDGTSLKLWLLKAGKEETCSLPIPPEYQ